MTGPGTATPITPAATLESALARVLQVGTYASMAFVAVGTLLFIAAGGSPLDAGPPFDLARLPGDLATGRPEGFLWLGILGVVATPALRVLGALLGFVRGGERRMAAVAVGIIAVVAVGILAGLLTG